MQKGDNSTAGNEKYRLEEMQRLEKRARRLLSLIQQVFQCQS